VDASPTGNAFNMVWSGVRQRGGGVGGGGGFGWGDGVWVDVLVRENVWLAVGDKLKTRF